LLHHIIIVIITYYIFEKTVQLLKKLFDDSLNGRNMIHILKLLKN